MKIVHPEPWQQLTQISRRSGQSISGGTSQWLGSDWLWLRWKEGVLRWRGLRCGRSQWRLLPEDRDGRKDRLREVRQAHCWNEVFCRRDKEERQWGSSLEGCERDWKVRFNFCYTEIFFLLFDLGFRSFHWATPKHFIGLHPCIPLRYPLLFFFRSIWSRMVSQSIFCLRFSALGSTRKTSRVWRTLSRKLDLTTGWRFLQKYGRILKVTKLSSESDAREHCCSGTNLPKWQLYLC